MRFEQLEPRLLAACAPTVNLSSPLDVDQDGHISPADVLCIANQINEGDNSPSSGDVNRDGVVSAIDALMVTNFINECFGLGNLADDELLGVQDERDVFGCALHFPELITLPLYYG